MKDLTLGMKCFTLLVLLALTVFVFEPGLSGSFFFDDKSNIVDNPVLTLFTGSFSSLVAASANGFAGPLGRPLAMASFAVNAYFFGMAPYSFKIVNLAIHLANGVLVFLLAQQLLPALSRRRQSSPAALWVSAIWILHPINLTPVLFVVQRMTSMAAFFTLAALCLYIAGRKMQGRRRWTAIGVALVLCWPAALLSKESGIVLPLFIILCEWLVLGGLSSFSRRTLSAVAGALTIAVVIATIYLWPVLGASYRLRDFNMAERLMTESRILWFYVYQIVAPLPDLFSLHHDDFTISRSLLAPVTTLPAIGAWGVAMIAAFLFRRRYPALTFAVFWFLASHLLESTVLPLELVYEHRNYLASLGFLMLFATMLDDAFQYKDGKLPKQALAAAFMILCALVSYVRASQWGDEYRRTVMEAAMHPNSPGSNYEAGLTTIERTFLSTQGGNPLAYQAAHFYFKRAADLDQNGKAPVIGLLYLDCLAGKPADVVQRNELVSR